MFKFPSESAHAKCDFAEATQVGSGSTGPVSYTIAVSDPETLYFACEVMGHCLGGQHLTVSVKSSSTPVAAAPVAAAPAAAAPTAANVKDDVRIDASPRVAASVAASLPVLLALLSVL